MLYGFYGPTPGVAPITVWGVKANSVEGAGSLTVGPTAIWGAGSQSKSNAVTQIIGDWANAPMLYGLIWDPEWVDNPVSTSST